MPSLSFLFAQANHFSGTIPSQLGRLTHLQMLSIGANSISGTIPQQLGELTDLVSLSLPRMQISGTLPTQLGKLTNIATRMLLNDNQISGTLSPALSQVFCHSI